MKTIAIIPARAGSKGIPGKNIYPILGKPLISYSIESALESKKLSSIIVSSDDKKVQSIVQGYKGYRRILFHDRPKYLADDKSKIIDTVIEVLNNFLPKENIEAVMLLQPTSPIRSGIEIDEAIHMLEKNSSANSIVSVCAMDDLHPARMYWSNEGYLNAIMPLYEKARRQDIPLAYYRNGAIYLTKICALKTEKSFVARPIIPYLMPESKLLNIDSPRDIMVAEVLIKLWLENKL
jgi:CMP-N,N'-diacetyllegionaminic acid synthase